MAILAVSSAAVLVRWSSAAPLALAFWRTAGGAVVLAGPARRSGIRPVGRQWWWLLGAGTALGLHFATWLASLQQTSIAASVTLVTSAPIMIALLAWAAGKRPPGRTWLAIAVTLTGALIIVGGDAREMFSGGTASEGSGRSALAGDGLALAGAVMLAIYLVIGDRLRASLPTSVYSSWTYGLAAASLAPAALLTGTPLSGFDRQTWLVIAATIAGPQLAGHTALNMLLRKLGSITVSLALLAEPFGASLLAWLLFAEVPPLAAAIGAPVVVAGLVLQLSQLRSS